MIRTPSHVLTAAAVLLITGSSAMADRQVRRIDHPNGPSTYLAQNSNRTSTIAVYANEQGVASASASNTTARENRVTRIQLGRGQSFEVQSGSR